VTVGLPDVTAVLVLGLDLSVASIFSVIIFIIVACSCLANGLFSTAVTFFVIVFSAMLAVAFFEPLCGFPMLSGMGWYAPPVCYMATFLLSASIMQTLTNYLYPPRLVMPKRVNLIGGGVLGLLNALFLTGFLMTGFALLPGTGGPEEKAVFLNADVFFARSMEWMSRQAGSVRFDAAQFLRDAKKEKQRYTVLPMGEPQMDRANGACFIALDALGKALKNYVQANHGAYPAKLDDLKDHLRGQESDEARERRLRCPLTGMRYRLFPVGDYASVEGDKDYVLIYDAVGGEAGHLGYGKGKRPALCADGRVRWIAESDLKVLLEAQQAALETKAAR
jgi:hypothetical protein